MNTSREPGAVAPPSAVSRRAVLYSAIAAGTALALGGSAVFGSGEALAAEVESTEFLRLSEFLTGGKPLLAKLATRYRATLAKFDPKFAESVAALQAYVAQAKAANIDELLARPDLSEPLKKSITQIVSAWYLGIVGDDKHVELVAYADALMYRPTNDVIVVPSYGGGPDSWGEKPAGISTTPNAVLKPANPQEKKTS
ncbi:sugar dehydrogenase complex small subunit [Xylophilus sp. GOD-11R]|uniref:sugar dehydrogenase complex small subunit n=1 Tax=Xylophilus sp. GOD-11R TaxID=3089814 RepID=UPI00298CCC36|nr:sugar dehydrogenase complex small subunit [Xylophilus sp. GOD-11R]WPB58989.1 sugar dehydrogenase complex small subunit [Xylophilus sp. GOD-11R]